MTKTTRDIVILGSARTPHGKFLGALAGLTPVELGTIAVKAAIDRSGINPEHISEFVLGNVVSAGTGQAL
ncbi:MAG TPA: hypothetical protein PLZ51_11395, partial [Aggregatilineales bacterium]|nr:hypothetical protein [Aggregatilineales bacterium]